MIYYIHGKKIPNLVDDDITFGKYDLTFNATYLLNGLYFYQLKAESFIQQSKMMITKQSN